MITVEILYTNLESYKCNIDEHRKLSNAQYENVLAIRCYDTKTKKTVLVEHSKDNYILVHNTLNGLDNCYLDGYDIPDGKEVIVSDPTATNRHPKPNTPSWLIPYRKPSEPYWLFTGSFVDDETWQKARKIIGGWH